MKPPQKVGYAKHFDSNKTVAYKATEKKLLKSILKKAEK